MDLTDRLAIARGERPADTLLTNLQLVNVFTGEVYRSEIAIAGTHIAGVGEGYAAQQTRPRRALRRAGADRRACAH